MGITTTYSNGLCTTFIDAAKNPFNDPRTRELNEIFERSDTGRVKWPNLPPGAITNANGDLIFETKYQIIQTSSNSVIVHYPDHPWRNKSVHVVGETTNGIHAIATVSSDEKIHFADDDMTCWVGETPEERASYRRVNNSPATN